MQKQQANNHVKTSRNQGLTIAERMDGDLSGSGFAKRMNEWMDGLVGSELGLTLSQPRKAYPRLIHTQICTTPIPF